MDGDAVVVEGGAEVLEEGLVLCFVWREDGPGGGCCEGCGLEEGWWWCEAVESQGGEVHR